MCVLRSDFRMPAAVTVPASNSCSVSRADASFIGCQGNLRWRPLDSANDQANLNTSAMALPVQPLP